MHKENKKWAVNNLTYHAMNFELLKAHSLSPCAFIYEKYFSFDFGADQLMHKDAQRCIDYVKGSILIHL